MITKANAHGTVFLLVSLLALAAQASAQQGNCCGDLFYFDLGGSGSTGCPGTPSFTSNVSAWCVTDSGLQYLSETLTVSGTGQCQKLEENCLNDYAICEPEQVIIDFGPSSTGHTLRVSVRSEQVDWDPANPTCSPGCMVTSTNFNEKNCPCDTCESQNCDHNPQPPGGCPSPEVWSGPPDCQCEEPDTPIIVSVRGNRLELTNPTEGVNFDLDADGYKERVAWTRGSDDDAFLVLDRNGNGQVDDGTELFGNATPQPSAANPNGFLALAVFDQPENGGNRDGKISQRDAVFYDLALWLDWNHNGVSEPNELSRVTVTRIEALHLDYRVSRRRDEHGNIFRYYSIVDMRGSSPGPRRKFAVDVQLLSEP